MNAYRLIASLPASEVSVCQMKKQQVLDVQVVDVEFESTTCLLLHPVRPQVGS